VSFPVGKIAEKNSLQECNFDNMALYFECQNGLLQTVFLEILPTGIGKYLKIGLSYEIPMLETKDAVTIISCDS